MNEFASHGSVSLPEDAAVVTDTVIIHGTGVPSFQPQYVVHIHKNYNTSHSIISCSGLEIFVYIKLINRTLTMLCC